MKTTRVERHIYPPSFFYSSINILTYSCIHIICPLTHTKIKSTHKNKHDMNSILKSYWSDLHFCSLYWIVVAFPVIPVDSISIWWVLAVMIHTVKIGIVTTSIPPGSFVGHSTVTDGANVIILIFCWKGITTVIGKRIASGSLKRINRNKLWTII